MIERTIGYPRRPLPDWVRPPWKPGQLFAMTETARRFHRDTSLLKAMAGGLGAAKTLTLCSEGIRMGFRHLGKVGGLFEPTIPLVIDVLKPSLEGQLEAFGLRRGQDWIFRATERAWLVLGGAQRGGFTILGRPMLEWERIIGINLAWAGMDEPARAPAEALAKVSDRTRGGPVFLAGTPDPGTWFAKWVKNPPPGASVHRASTLENPYVRQSGIDQLMRDYDAVSIRAYLYGESVEIAGNAYHRFVNAPYPAGNILPCQYDPRLPLYIATDNNTNPKPAVLFQLVAGQMRCFTEIQVYGGAWDPLAEAVHARVGGVKPNGIGLHGDVTDRHVSAKSASAGWGGYGDFRDELVRVFGGVEVQLMVPAGNPLELARVSITNGWLCNAAGERRLVIDPMCTHLIADMESVSVDDNGRLRKPGRAGGQGIEKGLTDHSDAIGYACVVESERQRSSRTGRPLFLTADLKL